MLIIIPSAAQYNTVALELFYFALCIVLNNKKFTLPSRSIEVLKFESVYRIDN